MTKIYRTLGLAGVLAAVAFGARAGSVADDYAYDGTTSYGPSPTIVVPGPGQSGNFQFTFDFLGLSNNGLTWHYKVTENNRDISHFVLGLCLDLQDHIVAIDGDTDFNFGDDEDYDFGASLSPTDADGLKFDNLDNRVNGMETFTITFDAVYKATLGTLTAKAGPNDNFGQILTPDCEECGPPQVIPTPTAAAAGLIGLGLIGMRRRNA